MLLLELFSFFHHEGITEEIFSYAALQEDQESSYPELPLASSILNRKLLPLNKRGTWDNFLFREGLQTLLSFSLIKNGPSDCVYAMHPLVHTWGRDRLDLNERKKCCLMAYVTLACSLRMVAGQPSQISSMFEDYSDGFMRALVTHVRANMEHSRSESNQNSVGYLDDAYAKFGRLLHEQGYFKEAEPLAKEVVDTRSRILGVEYRDTINAMAILAFIYRKLGKYTEAEKLFKEAETLVKEVVDTRSIILGVEHPDTMNAMTSLAFIYGQQGKYKEAESLEVQVLDIKHGIHGVKNPHTTQPMGHLATTQNHLEKHTEAENLQIEVLDAGNRILGVEHPNTIKTMGNLAIKYKHLEKYTEAEKLEMQILNAMTSTLGVEHPHTIEAMGNLATTYQHLGKYTEAENLQIQVLDARNRILEVEHLRTIQAMGNLATTYKHLEKYTEAEKLKAQAHELMRRVPAAEFPHTITTMTNVQEAQEIQVVDAGSKVPDEENLQPTEVALNHPIQAVLPDTTMTPEKKGMHFGNCSFNPL